MPTPTYNLIASNVLGSSASSVIFSSIPATYRDLVLICSGYFPNNGEYKIQFNSDTGSNYNYVKMQTDNTSTSGTGQTYIASTTGNLPSYTPVLYMLEIFDYAQTNKHKTCLSKEGGLEGAVSAIRWASTSALNSIEITTINPLHGFGANSSFEIYGVA